MEPTNTKACQVEGCKRPYRAKGYCQTHFKKWRRGEMPKKPRYKICGEENCRKPLFRFGRCEEHYQNLLKVKHGGVEAPPEAPKEEAKPKAAAEPKPQAKPDEKKE